jgi:dynein heavy chain
MLLQVPPAWAAAAYPSSKPLASWLADLARRVGCLRQWLVTGQPNSFWLPGEHVLSLAVELV